MRKQPSDRPPQLEEQEARLFDSAWAWLTAALVIAVAVAIIAITTNVMRPITPVSPVAIRPPADDPANPPAAAAPNTPRIVDAARIR